MAVGNTSMRHETLQLDTADGRMRTHLFSPDDERCRIGIVFYMDVFGICDELFEMCGAFARRGFVVYLPNLFYRAGDVSFPTPTFEGERGDPAAVELNVSTTIDMTARDLPAILAHAAAHAPTVGSFGAVGYCMGARHALKALAAHPSRIKAAASIHGGRMVTDGPDSPHRLIATLAGPAYFALAHKDKACPEAHQRLIEDEVARAPIKHAVERFQAHHGWSFPDRYCHDAAVAAHCFERTVELFKQTCGDRA